MTLKSSLLALKSRLQLSLVVLSNFIFRFKPNFIFTVQFRLAGVPTNLSVNPLDYRASILLFNRQDHKIAFMRDVCAIRSKPIFLDIGANYGEFSVSMKPYVSSLIAVEPNPHLYSHLVYNIFQNTPSSIPVAVVTAACVGDDSLVKYSSEKLKLSFDTSYSGGSSLLHAQVENSTSGPLMFYGKLKTMEVPTVRISNIIRQICASASENSRHVVIKIDVEGAEFSILKGIESCLDFCMNHLSSLSILFEFNENSFEKRDLFSETLRNFEDRGFSIMSIGSNIDNYIGPVSRTVDELDLSSDQEIFLASHGI